VDERIRRTTEIEKTTMEIEEKGVKLRLTIVDTPGKSYKSISTLVKLQFELNILFGSI